MNIMQEKLTNYFNRRYIDLLIVMTEKELKARYKNTMFGFLWVIINPLIQMLVIGFVFRFIIREPIANYYLYLFVGLLIWNFFSLTLSKTSSCIVNERSLIKKAKFPREVIPISIIISNFINTVIAFTLLAIPIIYYQTFSLKYLPMLFVGIVLLLVFTIGLSLLTSTYNVRFRDVSFFVQAVLIVWFYATPIVYSITLIPHELTWIWRLNPLVVIIQIFQGVLVSAPPPSTEIFITNTMIILVMFILGIYVFNKESKYFDDWV